MDSLEQFCFKTNTVFGQNLTVTTKYFSFALWPRLNNIRAKFFLPLHLLQKHIVVILQFLRVCYKIFNEHAKH